jgi:hypothetical protein
MTELIGGVFGGGLTPIENVDRLPLEQKVEQIEGFDGCPVVEDVHPTRPSGLPRFEMQTHVQDVTPLAASAPTLSLPLKVREWTLPSMIWGAVKAPTEVGDQAPAEDPESIELARLARRVERDKKREERLATRFDAAHELQLLDQERYLLGKDIDQLEEALSALGAEVDATPLPKKILLIARSNKHKSQTELQLQEARNSLSKNKSRRQYLLKQAASLRQLSEEMVVGDDQPAMEDEEEVREPVEAAREV